MKFTVRFQKVVETVREIEADNINEAIERATVMTRTGAAWDGIEWEDNDPYVLDVWDDDGQSLYDPETGDSWDFSKGIGEAIHRPYPPEDRN